MSNFRFKILLSASVPNSVNEKYPKIPNAQLQIEEAVVALCRNIFQASGQVIFGGHPSISPLVAFVSAEYSFVGHSGQNEIGIEDVERIDLKNRQVQIYQSRAFEDVMPSETSALFNLGYANIEWTRAVLGEKYSPNLKDSHQCPQSLKLMRDLMIDQPIDAMVCIGGMEGVEEEVEIFRRIHPSAKIYLLKTSGGASALLAEQLRNFPGVQVIDEKIQTRAMRLSDYRRGEQFERGSDLESFSIEDNSDVDPEFNFIPYSYITAQIVFDVLNSKG